LRGTHTHTPTTAPAAAALALDASDDADDDYLDDDSDNDDGAIDDNIDRRQPHAAATTAAASAVLTDTGTNTPAPATHPTTADSTTAADTAAAAATQTTEQAPWPIEHLGLRLHPGDHTVPIFSRHDWQRVLDTITRLGHCPGGMEMRTTLAAGYVRPLLDWRHLSNAAPRRSSQRPSTKPSPALVAHGGARRGGGQDASGSTPAWGWRSEGPPPAVRYCDTTADTLRLPFMPTHAHYTSVSRS
jgi:hypothetical protein